MSLADDGARRVTDTLSIDEAKRALRARMTDARAYEARQLEKAGQAMAMRFPGALLDGRFERVAGYAPINSEIESGGVLSRLRSAGAKLCLPAVVGDDAPLEFRDWDFGQPLEHDARGIATPRAGAELVIPDILLVPCLAFDKEGGRLGYGAGHYDRTLARLRAEKEVTVVLLAYEIQRVDKVPTDAHDQRADWIVTESAAYEVTQALEGATSSE